MSHPVPLGFKLSGVHCGIKRRPTALDISLVAADEPAVAAGVFTTNLVVAAPVVLDRARTPSDSIRAVITNSGNANACTGEQGDRDAAEMSRIAAAAIGCRESQVLVMSTGIIGEPLPMEKIAAGIASAAEKLSSDQTALLAAAQGILTTDKEIKLASRRVESGGHVYHITGMAKGAGMIGPKMATMLAVILTDAHLEPADAQDALNAAADESFNCVSVDGHMSTNDTALLLASGKAGGGRLADEALAAFQAELKSVCIELARAMAADGEGATHLICVEVDGCRSRDDALAIAKTVANSPLVKTAVTGHDPNWGRVVSAAGYAGVLFDPADVRLTLNGTLLFENGGPVPFDAGSVSHSMQNQHETHVHLTMGTGSGRIRFFSSDLTHEYIRINADYHT